MKIAIITINGHNNYGNRLQNYAMQTFLKFFTENVDTIWCDEKYNYIVEKNETKKIYNIKYIINYLLNRNDTRTFIKRHVYESIREYNIKKFSDKNINIRYDFGISNDLNNEYDYFIVGSDQVWNPFFWDFWNSKKNYIKIRFLQFANKEKRIAYAASFGISEIPENYIDLFKINLKNMKAISVREKNGSKIIEKLIGKKVPVVVDPTILLSKEEWQKIELIPEWHHGEKYILTYFLGNPSPIIENLAKKNGWKIYNLMDKSNLDLYASRVEEFVYLIEHAELVATDSFHACVFSILMNTPFLVINRQQKGVADMTSRIDTLLELFGFQDRYMINGECNLSDEEILYMDFSNVESIQKREIERSTAYIKKALDLK